MVYSSINTQNVAAKTSDHTLSESEDDESNQSQALASVLAVHNMFQDFKPTVGECHLKETTMNLSSAQSIFFKLSAAEIHQSLL